MKLPPTATVDRQTGGEPLRTRSIDDDAVERRHPQGDVPDATPRTGRSTDPAAGRHRSRVSPCPMRGRFRRRGRPDPGSAVGSRYEETLLTTREAHGFVAGVPAVAYRVRASEFVLDKPDALVSALVLRCRS